MKKKLFLVLILLFIVFVSNSIAQEGSTVEKKIYIIGDASVLSGLNIYEKDTGKLICHAEVGDDGNFSCTLNADSILSEEEIFKIVAEVIVKILKDINIQAEPVWTKVE